MTSIAKPHGDRLKPLIESEVRDGMRYCPEEVKRDNLRSIERKQATQNA